MLRRSATTVKLSKEEIQELIHELEEKELRQRMSNTIPKVDLSSLYRTEEGISDRSIINMNTMNGKYKELNRNRGPAVDSSFDNRLLQTPRSNEANNINNNNINSIHNLISHSEEDNPFFHPTN